MNTEDRRSALFGLALGIFATLSQVILMRESLVISHGNELAIGIGLFIWLSGVGAGALLGKFIPPIPLVMTIVTAVAPLVVTGSLAVLRLHRQIIHIETGATASMLQLVLLFGLGVGICSMLVGFTFTLGTLLLGRTQAPKIYIFEAIGALIGGITFSFVLSGNWDHLSILLPVCAFFILSTVPLLKLKKHRIAALLWVFIFLCVGFTGGPHQLDTTLVKHAFNQIDASGNLVAAADTKYGRITIGERQGQYQVFKDGKIAFAFPDPWTHAPIIHLALSQHTNPKNILVLGHISPDHIQAALQHNVHEIHYLITDPLEYKLLSAYWHRSIKNALRDPRIIISVADSRQFLQNHPNTFDTIVLLTGPPQSANENRFHTAKFYALIKTALSSTGVFTVQTKGSANVFTKTQALFFANTIATLKTSFQKNVLIPGTSTIIHSTVSGSITTDVDELNRRYVAQVSKETPFSPYQFESMLQVARQRQALAQIHRVQGKVNRDQTPAAYLLGLKLKHQQITQSLSEKPSGTIDFLRHSLIYWLFIPVGLWAILRILQRKQGQKTLWHTASPVDVSFAIFTTGAAGIGVEIILLYTIASSMGGLYTHIAWLIAAFMAGLAGGAQIGARLQTRRWSPLVSDLSVFLVLIATGPVLSIGFSNPWIIAIWSVLSGMVTGFAFPIFLHVMAALSLHPKTAPAKIEASDHLGAAFGAIVTSLVWLPILGITWTCVLFAAQKLPTISTNFAFFRKSCEQL